MISRETFEKRIIKRYINKRKCYFCKRNKVQGVTGEWYCPHKHGTGKGPDIANQPASY